MMNMFYDSVDFELPEMAGRRWWKAVDTALAPPLDIADAGDESEVAGNTFTVQGRSVVVLINRSSV